MQLNMQRLRPYIQDVEDLLLHVWNIAHTEPKKPKQAIIEFSYQIFTHAQAPLYRSLPDKAEIILMEDFLLNEYSFSPSFPFTREEMRQAIQTEGGTY